MAALVAPVATAVSALTSVSFVGAAVVTLTESTVVAAPKVARRTGSRSHAMASGAPGTVSVPSIVPATSVASVSAG